MTENDPSPNAGVAAAQPALLALTPRYDASNHELYFNAIEAALTGEDRGMIRNTALTGSYGVGKSSILQGVAEEHKGRVVQLSLSSIGQYEGPRATRTV